MSPICSVLRSSRTLTSFSKGMMTSRTPLRLAASTFSLIPPMGSTCPVRVISPVMARLVGTLRSVSMESSAVAMVMPALGPSLGMAPAGTWMWMSLVLNRSGSMPYLVALARTQVSAACTDSCMTGPSCPVMMRPLLPPGMRPASMNRTSPPTGVQARPTATPGRATAVGDFGIDAVARRAEILLDHNGGGQDLLALAFGDAAGLLAADGADLALQVAYAGFAGVTAHDEAHRVFAEFDVLPGGEAVLGDLPRHQVAEGDDDFLLLGVAFQGDDFHAVAQGVGHRVEDVGGGDEEDFGEVEGNVQVVVAVGGILFGVEDFEEDAGRVATEIAAEPTKITRLRIPDRGRMPTRSSALSSRLLEVCRVYAPAVQSVLRQALERWLPSPGQETKIAVGILRTG